MSRKLKFPSIFLIIFALLIFLLQLAVENPYTQNTLTSVLRKITKSTLDQELKVNAIAIDFLPPSLTAYGVAIKRTPDSKHTINADSVQLSLSIKNIFLGRKKYINLSIKNLQADFGSDVNQAPSHDSNEDVIVEPQNHFLFSWPPGNNFRFSQIELINANIRTEWQTNQKRNWLLMNAVDAKANISGSNSWIVNLKSNHTNLIIEDKIILQKANVQTTLHAPNGLSFESKDLNIKSDEINMNGRLNVDLISQEKRPQITRKNPTREISSINIQGDFDVSKGRLEILGRYLNAPQSSGDFAAGVKLALNIGSVKNDLLIDIKLKSQKSLLAGFTLLDSQINMKINQDGIDFYDIKIIDEDNHLANATGHLSFSENVEMSYELRTESLTLKKLLSIIKVNNFNTLETHIQTENLTIFGTGSPFKLNIKGDSKLKGIFLPSLNDLSNEEADHQSFVDCDTTIDIEIDDKEVNFGSTQGTCFHQQKSQGLPASKLALAGYISLSDHKKTNLKILIDDNNSGITGSLSNTPFHGNIQTHIHLTEIQDKPMVTISSHSKKLLVTEDQYNHFKLDIDILPDDELILIRDVEIRNNDDLFVKSTNLKLKTVKPFHISGPVFISKINSKIIDYLKSFYKINANINTGIGLIQGELDTSFHQIRDFKGDIRFDLKNLEIANQPIAESLSGKIEGSSDELKISDGHLKKSAFSFTYTGNLQKEEAYRPITEDSLAKDIGLSENDRFEFEIINRLNKKRKLNNSKSSRDLINELPFVRDIIDPTIFASDIDFVIKIQGNREKIQGNFEGEMIETYVLGSPIASTQFSGFIDGSKISIPLIKHSGDSLIARLNVDFGAESFPFDWQIFMQRFDFRPFLGKFFAQDPRNYAYLSASSLLKGKLRDWWNSEGNLDISGIAVGYFNDVGDRTQKIDLLSEDKINLILEKNYWGFEKNRSLKLRNQLTEIKLDLSKNNPPNHLSVNVESTINLAVIEKFWPNIDFASGNVDLNLLINGSVSNPVLSMDIRDRALNPFSDNSWQPLTIGVKNLAPPFNNIKIDASYKNGQLDIKNVRADKGKQGGIQANGIINFSPNSKKISQLNINLDQASINGLDLPSLPSTNVILSGSLNLSGSQAPFLIKGDINIDKAQSIGNYDLRNQIIESLSSQRLNKNISTGESREDPLTQLDIDLRANQTIFVKNRNLESSLSGDLTIKGTEKKPVILGQISADDGSFSYKQKFTIERAIVSFEEPITPPNPRLDILGEAFIDDYQVTVQITGTASNPLVNFEIEPSSRPDGTLISKIDIIVLISSGKLPAYSDQSPIKLASSEALNLFVGFAEGPLEKIFNASGQTYVRQVYLDTYLSENQSRPITRLNLPVDLGKDLTIILQVDDDENFKLSSQYELHDNISVSGSFDKKREVKKISDTQSTLPTDTTVDLRFKFSFD